MFEPARAKLTIGSLDTPNLTVKAHYNPKELQVTKQLSWKAHNEGDPKVLAGQKPAQSTQDSIEMTGAPVRSMSIELMFDGYETKKSVAPEIAALEELSSPTQQVQKSSKEKRPHFCVVVWGQKGIPAFRCVVEQLVVKYTMLDTNGLPLRAVCTVTLKEANIKLTAAVDGQEDQVVQRAIREDYVRAIERRRG